MIFGCSSFHKKRLVKKYIFFFVFYNAELNIGSGSSDRLNVANKFSANIGLETMLVELRNMEKIWRQQNIEGKKHPIGDFF